MSRVRLSLRALLVLVAALCAGLALAQLSPTANGFLLAALATVLNLLLPLRTWRYLSYGALLGMLAIMAAMAIDVRVRTGLGSATNYSESSAMDAVARKWRPYILPVGAVVGGAAGFVLMGVREGGQRDSSAELEMTR